MKKEISLFFILIFFGILGYVTLKVFFPEYYFSFYPAIPLYFIALALITLGVLHSFKSGAANKILTMYMGMKIAKLFISLALVILYLKKSGEQSISFVIAFMSFYFIYLACETVYFSKFLKKKESSYRVHKNE